MSRKNHEMVDGRLLQTDKPFSQLKQSQKEKISEWLYQEYAAAYQAIGLPPDSLIGTPGAGKTHYSIALGVAACMKGYSVFFASIPNLVVELKETMSNNRLSNYRKRFEKYDLVILDELGYVSMDKSGCEMLFSLISSRNDKGSIIVNSNLSFDRWEEVFKDPTLTGALIDRLAHKAHVLDISRDKGGRFEETIAWLDSKR